jgi:hypothetical protein
MVTRKLKKVIGYDLGYRPNLEGGWLTLIYGEFVQLE